MVAEYVAPYKKTNVAILALASWTSDEIEVPYWAGGFWIDCKTTADGTLHTQKEIGGAWATFDSLPVLAGAVTTPTRVFNFRVPVLRFIFTPALGAPATISFDCELTAGRAD